MAASAKGRRRAVHDFKRRAILDAAKTILATQGLEGATVRAIAQEAGYSPGAIYAYYPAKEEIYGDILARSLSQAGQAVRAAADGVASPRARLKEAVGAYYDYYRQHPQEFELSLYLGHGARRAQLSAERQRLINGRLIALLQVIAKTVSDLGPLSPEETNRETVEILSHLEGLLVLENSGRLRVLGFDGEALLGHYLGGVLARLQAGR